MRRMLWRFLLALFAGVLLPLPSLAHPLDPILLEIFEVADGLEIEMRYPMAPRPGMTPLGVALPHACEVLPFVDEKRAGGLVRRRWRAHCGGRTLAGRTVAIQGLAERENDALIRVVLESGETLQAVVGPDSPSWKLPRQSDKQEVAADYIAFGFEHILGGFDHLLFILGLLMLVPTCCLIGATIVFGVWTEWSVDFARQAASLLLGGGL